MATGVFAAELSEKFAKRLESADANYQSAVQKAGNVRFYAVQKAAQERAKILKVALSDATKAGDFEAATVIKSQLAAVETAVVPAKPKDTFKIGAHEYAIVVASLPFHLAKKECEAMGGHLVTFESSKEQALILAACKQRGLFVWIGATDEAEIDKWKWVTGAPVELDADWKVDNGQKHAVGMTYYPGTGTFNDENLGARIGYVCEWEK